LKPCDQRAHRHWRWSVIAAGTPPPAAGRRSRNLGLTPGMRGATWT